MGIQQMLFIGSFHGDTCKTFLIGNVDKEGRLLVEHAKKAMEAGIQVCGPGKPLTAIGDAISAYVKNTGYSIIEQFTGHGIGR
jgi:methionyl aminopeptidase